MTTTVRYSRNPLVKALTAEFVTEFGTTYQIVASEDASIVRFGVWNTKVASEGWTHGMFRYADAWREKNNYPVAWNPTTFKQMVEDYIAEAQEGK
jgi:hypothetical protein